MRRKTIQSSILNALISLALVISLMGCNGSSSSTSTDEDQSQSAAITLSASPTTVSPNDSTTLTWSSTNTTSCSASGGWSGNKGTSGSEVISQLQTDTVFNLTCTGDNGSVDSSVSVTVSTEGPASPTVSLVANPTSVSLNGSTTLTWLSNNTESCSASGHWSGSRGTSGEETIDSLTENSTFTLTCTGPGGAQSDTVNVVVDDPAVTVDLTASPSTISLNGSTTLTWNSTNAESCTASGDWSGSKDLSGTETIDGLTGDRQFTLTCSNAYGSVSDSVDVTITSSSNGTALLSWTPPTQNTDGSALTDLTGYIIYYGTASNNYTETVNIDNPGITSYQIDNLSAADWYFVITAVNSSNVESVYSSEVSKTID
ncbi:MAG: fibronectin type III domain-containing protein [Candidatus Thiodiazotropha sp.]